MCRLSLWKGPKGVTDEFYGFITSRKRYTFAIDSYLKDSAFTAVKREAMQSSIQGMWKGVPFVNRRYTKGVPFFLKNGIQKGKRLDLGTFVE